MAAVAVGCTIEETKVTTTSPAVSGSGDAAPYAPTPLASKVGSDPDALLRAYREHAPTDEEKKLVAAYFSLLIVAHDKGEIDPVFFDGKIPEHVVAIAAKYPSFFTRTGGGASAAALSTGALHIATITTPDDFACGNSCLPSAESLQKTLTAIGQDVGQMLASRAALARDAYALYDTINRGLRVLKSGQNAVDQVDSGVQGIIQGQVSLDMATRVLDGVGSAVVSAATIASLATAAGIAAPELGTLVAAGTVVNAIQGTIAGYGEYKKARALVDQCFAWKAQKCDDGSPVAADECGGCPSGLKCKLCPGDGAKCLPPGLACCEALGCGSSQVCMACGSSACGSKGACGDAGADGAAPDGSADGGAPAGPAGTTWGDPHLVTFDGAMYDLQVVGELVLATDGAGFVVQTRQAPFSGSTTIATNTAVAAKVGSHRVGVYAGQDPPLRVDGAPTSVTGSLALSGGGAIALDAGVYTVTWADGSSLRVQPVGAHLDVKLWPAAALAGKLSGLLGSLDGKAGNDLVTRAGAAVDPPSAENLTKTFANSWRIAQAESLFDYDAGQSTATFTDASFPSAYVTAASLDAQKLAYARGVCTSAGITDPALLDACILDVGATGDASFASGAAAAPLPGLAVRGYSASFDDRAPGPEWSTTRTSKTPGTPKHPVTTFLGQFGGTDAAVLRLTGLGAHQQVIIEADVYVIRSWDGDSADFGPDIFGVSADGATLLLTSFSNTGPTQAFPGTVTVAKNPMRTGAAETDTLGYDYYGDAVYHLKFVVPHTKSDLTVSFVGYLTESIANESWGIDNVSVTYVQTQAP